VSNRKTKFFVTAVPMLNQRKWMCVLSLVGSLCWQSSAVAELQYGLTPQDIPKPLSQGWDNREVGVFLPSALDPHGLPRSQILTKPIKSLDLMAAILYALRHNVDAINDQMQRINDKYQFKVTVRGFSPSFDNLTLGMSKDSLKGTTYQFFSPTVEWENAWGTDFKATVSPGIAGQKTSGSVSIKQPLWKDFNLSRLELFDAQDSLQQARYTYQSGIEQVVMQVIQSYVQWVQNKMDFENSDANLREQKIIFNNARQKELQGKISVNDLRQQKSSLLTTQLSLQKQKIDLMNNKQDLLQLLGFSPLDTSKVTIDSRSITALIDAIKIPSQDDSIQVALLHNSGYQQSLIKIKQDQRKIVRGRNALKWDFSLGYTHNFGLDKKSQESIPVDTIGLNLVIPINTLEEKSKLISDRISYEIEKLRLRNSKQKLIRTIVKDSQTLADDKQQLQLNMESEKLKKELLDAAMLKLKFGKITEFEVASLRQDYISQQQNTVAKRMRFFLDYNQLHLDRGDLLSLWHLTLQY
jgi:outer membrane protein